MTKNELAKRLRVSLTTIDTWIRKGLPIEKKGERGRGYVFDLRKVERWCRENAGTSPSQSLVAERIRLIRIQADQRELKLFEEQGKLLRADQMVRYLSAMFYVVRNKFLAFPTKLAPLLVGIDTPAEVMRILDKHVRELLTDLSEPDISEVEKHIKRARGK